MYFFLVIFYNVPVKLFTIFKIPIHYLTEVKFDEIFEEILSLFYLNSVSEKLAS